MAHYARGAYKAEIIDHGLSEASTGNPQIWLQCRILEFLDDPQLAIQHYDRTIYWTITDKTIDFVIEKLEHLGFSDTSFRQLDRSVEGHHSFVGQEVELFCKVETRDGKEVEKWDLSRPQGTRNIERLDDASARKLDALFGKKLKERFKKTPAQKQPEKPQPPVAVAMADDDIPF